MGLLFRCVLIEAAVAIAAPSGHLVYGQRQGSIPDQQIIREAKLVASGARVDLYQHDLAVDSALVNVAEDALAKMESMLGRKLDESTLGPRVRIYVSAATRISHVWRGYEHPSDPQPVLFLNAMVAQLAVRGTNATYAHELGHLLTWRYYSHTLREGLADYLASQVHPGAAIGPNIGGYGTQDVSREIDDVLGTTLSPPAAVINDMVVRRAYYYASYRFVHFLIDRAGMSTFLKLYDAKDPEHEFVRLYGANRRQLVLAASK